MKPTLFPLRALIVAFGFLIVAFAVFSPVGAYAQTLSAPPSAAVAADLRRISLNGQWKFATDYQNWGDQAEWFSPKLNVSVWDTVKVPHTWSHDPRLIGFVGAGWYRLKFTAPAVSLWQLEAAVGVGYPQESFPEIGRAGPSTWKSDRKATPPAPI